MIEQILEFDKNLFIFLNNLGNETWDWFWIFITNKFSMIPFYIFMVYVLFRAFGTAFWRPFLFTILTVVLCDRISVELFKKVFERLRPTHDESMIGLFRALEGKGGLYTFVSSHATNVFGMTTWFYLLLKDKYPAVKWMFVWAAIVAYSRVYVGKHYPIDILGGAILGYFIGRFVFFLWVWFTKKSWI
jgi:undecaprenyl-diphosphatase